MSLNVNQMLRWYAVNTEQNEGSFVNVYHEEDLWMESEHTKGTLPLQLQE